MLYYPHPRLGLLILLYFLAAIYKDELCGQAQVIHHRWLYTLRSQMFAYHTLQESIKDDVLVARPSIGASCDKRMECLPNIRWNSLNDLAGVGKLTEIQTRANAAQTRTRQA